MKPIAFFNSQTFAATASKIARVEEVFAHIGFFVLVDMGNRLGFPFQLQRYQESPIAVGSDTLPGSSFSTIPRQSGRKRLRGLRPTAPPFSRVAASVNGCESPPLSLHPRPVRRQSVPIWSL